MIDSRQAAEALSEIDEIARRVRQSTIYQLASLTTVSWGVLVFAGNIGSFLWPRAAGYIWLAVYVVGIAGSFAVSAFQVRTGVRLDVRILLAYLLFLAFGFFCTSGLAHFTPRQMGTFWAIYFMLIYSLVGLWVGNTFVAIGYFFIGEWFEPWMAVVNGGGLILGGLWMRRD
jgi:hypothetical protein